MNDDIRDLLYYVSISDQRNAKGKAIEICEKELAKDKNETTSAYVEMLSRTSRNDRSGWNSRRERKACCYTKT